MELDKDILHELRKIYATHLVKIDNDTGDTIRAIREADNLRFLSFLTHFKPYVDIVSLFFYEKLFKEMKKIKTKTPPCNIAKKANDWLAVRFRLISRLAYAKEIQRLEEDNFLLELFKLLAGEIINFKYKDLYKKRIERNEHWIFLEYNLLIEDLTFLINNYRSWLVIYENLRKKLPYIEKNTFKRIYSELENHNEKPNKKYSQAEFVAKRILMERYAIKTLKTVQNKISIGKKRICYFMKIDTPFIE
jgi:hypothetical protein